jgi:hypothetical protein
MFKYKGKTLKPDYVSVTIALSIDDLDVNDIICSYKGKKPESYCEFNGKNYYVSSIDGVNEELGLIFINLSPLEDTTDA